MRTTPPQQTDSGPNRHNIQHNTATANRFTTTAKTMRTTPP